MHDVAQRRKKAGFTYHYFKFTSLLSVLLKQLPMVTLLTLAGVYGVYLPIDLWLLTEHGIREIASEILVFQLYRVFMLFPQFSTCLLCRV